MMSWQRVVAVDENVLAEDTAEACVCILYLLLFYLSTWEMYDNYWHQDKARVLRSRNSDVSPSRIRDTLPLHHHITAQHH